MERETGTLLFSGPPFYGGALQHGGGENPPPFLSRKGSHPRKTCSQSFPSTFTHTVGQNRTYDESTGLLHKLTTLAPFFVFSRNSTSRLQVQVCSICTHVREWKKGKTSWGASEKRHEECLDVIYFLSFDNFVL